MINIIIFTKNKNIDKGIEKMNNIIEKIFLTKENWKNLNNSDEVKIIYYNENIRIYLMATDTYIHTRGIRYNIAYIDKDFTFEEAFETILPLGIHKIVSEQYF